MALALLRLDPDLYPFHQYVQYLSAGPYGWDRPLQLRCDEMNGRISLDQGFEQGILFRGPFVVAVFGHGNSPCSLARQHNGNMPRC
jgi:hypothetical protein